MIDAFKDYLAPKRFGIIAYVCVIVHFLCGLVFTAVTAALRASEIGKFSCIVDAKSTATYKTQVDKACFSRYEQVYNTPLPLYGFVLLSVGSTVLVSVIYSLLVSKRVDEIESSHERQADGGNGDAENHGHGENRTVYVFCLYFVHLVLRFLCGIIFTVLQHAFFFPNGFDLEFRCNLPPAEVTSNNININTPRNASQLKNNTSVPCENPTASEKKLFGNIVFVINVMVTFIILVEVIYLSRRLPVLNCHSGVSWSCDTEFVNSYFLRKQNVNVPDELQLETVNKDLQECIHIYKQEVLNLPRAPDINYLPKTALDDLHVDVIIHTERAQHKFSKNMARHEIYDVYMEVPSTSLRLDKIRDLFYGNEDTKGITPRRILVIGRPGIGKTVLTEKIIRDWANGIDDYYSDKIPLFFKFRWFNMDKLTNLPIKDFLQIGTGFVGEENFESIYEEITKDPKKAILIFDGLDEFNGSLISYFDQSRVISNDPNTCMSAMDLFVKIILGSFLRGATVLVTSRPTTEDFYSRLDFDRTVEIIGFSSNKVEEYVTRFCVNNNRTDLIPKIWSHINSSSELLNLCYIPENCFIVCVTLSGCLSDPENDTSALPTTLTELYQTAIDHFEKHHHKNADGNCTTEETLKKLQLISFRDGMENGQLIFDQDLFDEQTKRSGLVNSLSNPIFPIKTQFCFIHLTIQEFLAARHVTETFAPADIKKFISTHFERHQWHLVLQFIAGLLGKKMTMSDSEYKDCVMVFAKGFEETDDTMELDYNQVFVMKCLREVDHEYIAKDVFKTTGIKDVVTLKTSVTDNISPSDWEAVTFVCKHLENLSRFDLTCIDSDCLKEIVKLLQRRCIDQLILGGFTASHYVGVEHVFGALMNECACKHPHANLTWLKLANFGVSNDILSNILPIFENGHANHLEILDLWRIEISSTGISKLCEVLDSQHILELTSLDLSWNPICDEGAIVLFNTLIKGPRKLTVLRLADCLLTGRCIPALVTALQDEHCKLVELSLKENNIGDAGVRLLVDNVLTKEHCKLTELDLCSCSLTRQCISRLCKALQDEHCKLVKLSLGNNIIGDESVRLLVDDALTKEHCKLTELHLQDCSLTRQCISRLYKALQDQRCKLNVLGLAGNDIGDEGACVLFEDALTNENCKLTGLHLGHCGLTDKCIPTLCNTLQDERCGLKLFFLPLNRFTDNGKKMLRDVEKSDVGKARGLTIMYIPCIE